MKKLLLFVGLVVFLAPSLVNAVELGSLFCMRPDNSIYIASSWDDPIGCPSGYKKVSEDDYYELYPDLKTPSLVNSVKKEYY